ncbi:MAG TPA: hypothetical protein PKH16_15480 [Aequorivita sp.]|jgi:hypothetical protein|nr:hypothetical protein [Aequorivita sp.]
MSGTTDGFGKKRDHNQYGEVNKDKDDTSKDKDLPKPNNKGTEKDTEE